MATDYTVGDTIYVHFTTEAFSTGIPTVFSGSPVLSAYEDDSTTQITAGVSVTVDLDSVVGLNLATIVATTGNGFESGKQYGIIITAGTVDSVSRVGVKVGDFTLNRIEDIVWDTVLTGSTHNINNSSGKILRELLDATIIREDDFQTGSTTTSLVLDASSSSIDNFYRFQNIIVESGVAAGQVRVISSYNGTTKIADISEALVTSAPASGDTFQITTMGPVHAASQGGVYSGGKIYIDILNGAAGTVEFVNGTITNPVDNIADARTIADSLNITRYECASGSVITLDQEFARTIWTGAGYVVDLNGQDVGGIRVNNAFVLGTNTGTVLKLFRNCNISTITGDNMSFIDCALVGTVTASGGGTLAASNSFSNTDGVIDFSTSANQTVNILHHSGPLTVSNLGNTGTDIFNFDGMSPGTTGITFDASCTGGTANIAGITKLTNNGSGITINDDARIDVTQINDEVVDVIRTDAMSEVAQGVPSATPNMADATMLMYMALRNRLNVDTTGTDLLEIHNDAGTVIAKKVVTDDGTTYSEAKAISGP
jgi:hypothetical protein